MAVVGEVMVVVEVTVVGEVTGADEVIMVVAEAARTLAHPNVLITELLSLVCQ